MPPAYCTPVRLPLQSVAGCELTHEHTNQRTQRIAIPPGEAIMIVISVFYTRRQEQRSI